MPKLKMGKPNTISAFVKVWLTSSTSAAVNFPQRSSYVSPQSILSKAARTANNDLGRIWSDAK